VGYLSVVSLLHRLLRRSRLKTSQPP